MRKLPAKRKVVKPVPVKKTVTPKVVNTREKRQKDKEEVKKPVKTKDPIYTDLNSDNCIEIKDFVIYYEQDNDASFEDFSFKSEPKVEPEVLPPTPKPLPEVSGPFKVSHERP